VIKADVGQLVSTGGLVLPVGQTYSTVSPTNHEGRWNETRVRVRL